MLTIKHDVHLQVHRVWIAFSDQLLARPCRKVTEDFLGFQSRLGRNSHKIFKTNDIQLIWPWRVSVKGDGIKALIIIKGKSCQINLWKKVKNNHHDLIIKTADPSVVTLLTSSEGFVLTSPDFLAAAS